MWGNAVPLIKSSSKAALGKNISAERAAGKPQAQAVAIGLDVQRRSQRASGGAVGPLMGNTGGRADKLPMHVPDNSHVIPADVVAALGDGNSQHGHQVLSRMFPHSSSDFEASKPGLRKAGGKVPIMASDGEFIVGPDDVLKRGQGDMSHGHSVLDHFILHIRHQNIEHLKKLPPPAKD